MKSLKDTRKWCENMVGKQGYASGMPTTAWTILGLSLLWDKGSNPCLIDFSSVNLHNYFSSLSTLWHWQYAAAVSSQFNYIFWENYNLTICIQASCFSLINFCYLPLKLVYSFILLQFWKLIFTFRVLYYWQTFSSHQEPFLLLWVCWTTQILALIPWYALKVQHYSLSFTAKVYNRSIGLYIGL